MSTGDTRLLQLEDLQGLLASGFSKLRRGRAILLSLANGPDLLRDLIQSLLRKKLVASAGDIASREEDLKRETVTVALSFQGLRALGLQESPLRPFPAAFRQGMSSDLRTKLLGIRRDRPWDWGDTAGGQFAADCLLVHLWSDSDVPCGLLDLERLRAVGFGVRGVEFDENYIDALGVSTEAFGFRDGIAQPVLKGFRPNSRRHRAIRSETMAQDRLVEAGEFILGQNNEYQERSYCPDIEDWPRASESAGVQGCFGFNGSYLVAQQIGQNLAVFNDFETRHHVASGAPTVVEKLVGRKRDGSPLSTCPVIPDDGDSFRYRVDDADGFGCPRGAHVRRANPRDSLGQDAAAGLQRSRLHRLLRRGRGFVGSAKGSSWPRGLFFMALNADLDRQFEFIQQRWVMGQQFSDLADETDPLLGSRDRAFTMQGQPVGTRLEGLPAFTQVMGGGYFFMPSMSALEVLAQPAPVLRK